MPQGWTPEMSHFVRENFLLEEGLKSVQELFFAEYELMAKKYSENKKGWDAWFLSLRPAGCS